jgi:hypothetical protein
MGRWAFRDAGCMDRTVYGSNQVSATYRTRTAHSAALRGVRVVGLTASALSASTTALELRRLLH